MKRNKTKLYGMMILIGFSAFLYLESLPFSMEYSSVFTTSKQTEIQMDVVMNTFLDSDKEKLAEEIVAKHQEVNGRKEDVVYTLCLYRTKFHHKRNWEYDTIVCDENGAIICCEDDSRNK